MPRVNQRLPYVNAYKDRHGKPRYWYRRDGKRLTINGEFGSPEWVESYQAIHARFEGKRAPRATEGTFRFAVEEYFESAQFLAVKPKTQGNYRRALAPLLEAFGHAPLAKIKRGGLVRVRDNIAKTSPRKAVEALKVLNLVFENACDCDMLDRNPAKDIAKPVGYKAEPHRPWAQDEIDLFLGSASPVWRRAVAVLLYTGLRREDAINLTRDHIKNGMIYLTKEETGETTRKTGAEVIIPIHPRLKAELAEPMPISSVVRLLITGTRGRKIRGDVLTNSIRKEGKRLGLDNPPPLHGLRKNAVRRLVELGINPEDIQAITGQSIDMIKHYSQGYDRQLAAERAAAIIQIEDAGSHKNKS